MSTPDIRFSAHNDVVQGSEVITFAATTPQSLFIGRCSLRTAGRQVGQVPALGAAT
jgi:hypothetical protein